MGKEKKYAKASPHSYLIGTGWTVESNHLIIGAGNMGTRHAAALKRHGEKARLVDIGFNVADINGSKSVLICTPPETHVALIEQVVRIDRRIPIFCEKPVTTKERPAVLPHISMVACNWRYCDCWNFHMISCGYPNGDFLDLIHFVDLFWSKYGKPSGILTSIMGYSSIRLKKGRHELAATIWSGPEFCEINGYNRNVSHGCNMFEKEMRVWLDVIAGKKSPNPIAQALIRTKWLSSLRGKNRIET